MTLICLSIAWVIGIYTGSKLTFPLWTFATGMIPLFLIPFLLQYRTKLILFCFCLLVFLGGNLYYQSRLPQIDEAHLQFYNDQGKIEIEGMIITDPETRDKASIFQFSASKVTIGNESKIVSGKAIIRVPRYTEYRYGDMIKVSGEFETPPQFEDFNYREYLAHQSIYSTVYYPRIQILERNSGSRVLALIYSLRNSLSQRLLNALPEPHGSLAQGILLGLRGDINQALMQAFARTGTTHLIAISGINISIIIAMFLSIGILLFGRRYYIHIWIAFGIIWFYAIITGMHPPVIRGAIMGSMFLLAELLGRQRGATTSLIFAASVMVGLDPQILWDVSFQLSFLSMAGLVFIFPYLQALSRKWLPISVDSPGIVTPLYIVVADSLAVTLSAILVTWPVIAYYFGIVSLIALPANFFAIPSLPVIITTTAVVSIIGLFLPLIAHIAGWVAWLFLSYLILVVQIFDAFPLSSVMLSTIQPWQVLAYYVFLSMAVATLTHRNQFSQLLSSAAAQISQHRSHTPASISTLLKRWSIPLIVIATILVWTAVLTTPDNKLHVSILNVGQGDAILIQTPDHHNILIDGGPSPQAIKRELSKKLPFWDRTIDLMIVTQPQADHMTGLVEILGHYNVRQVITSGITGSSSIYNQMLSTIQNKQIETWNVHAGHELNLGDDIKMTVLHPPISPLQGTADNINNNGLVLRLSYNAVSFLLTGDIDEEAEWHLISQRAHLKSTVLKIAHHGSRTSTSSELLAVANPQIAVISVASDNNFGHPHPEVLTRLRQRIGVDNVFLTSQNGTIEFTTDGHRLWVRKE